MNNDPKKINKSSIYIETTILSYLVARPNRDIIIQAHQQLLGIGGNLSGTITTFIFPRWLSRRL